MTHKCCVRRRWPSFAGTAQYWLLLRSSRLKKFAYFEFFHSLLVDERQISLAALCVSTTVVMQWLWFVAVVVFVGFVVALTVHKFAKYSTNWMRCFAKSTLVTNLWRLRAHWFARANVACCAFESVRCKSLFDLQSARTHRTIELVKKAQCVRAVDGANGCYWRDYVCVA